MKKKENRKEEKKKSNKRDPDLFKYRARIKIYKNKWFEKRQKTVKDFDKYSKKKVERLKKIGAADDDVS